MSSPRTTGWSLLLIGLALSALAAHTHAGWLWLVAILLLVVSMAALAVGFVNDGDAPPDEPCS
ncbi:hypothetical protein [Actinomyces sp.]|uniref:hypothetical protein n=1 Tax=Actinomyces sp. TaxID=29317 RepID=UPI0026DAEFF2|nr:hypothetical protein [Actinomyces sp.]MDO4900374.1 hypothetical protein [Actinomyces sp.]